MLFFHFNFHIENPFLICSYHFFSSLLSLAFNELDFIKQAWVSQHRQFNSPNKLQ